MLAILVALGCWMVFLVFVWALFAVSARADAEALQMFGPRFEGTEPGFDPLG